MPAPLPYRMLRALPEEAPLAGDWQYALILNEDDQIGVYNGGIDGVTAMYVDDVSLEICSPSPPAE